MRLSYIEMAGFRGFRERVRFDFPGGFAVLTGRNGCGKSTVFDAVDFALTGSLSKYDVRDAKGGGLASHMWWVGDGAPEQSYVKIGFVDSDGKHIDVVRSRENGMESNIDDLARALSRGASSAPGAAPLWAQTLVQTSLIRDETIAKLSVDLTEQARFSAVRAAIGSLEAPELSKRTSALAQLAGSAREAQKARIEDLQAQLGRALTSLTEARGTVSQSADLAAAETVVSLLAPEVHSGRPGFAMQLRRLLAARKSSISQLEEALRDNEGLESELRVVNGEEWRATAAEANRVLDAAKYTRDSAIAALGDAEARALALNRSNKFVSDMTALLAAGEGVGLIDGHCPLCAARHSPTEFATALAASRAKLGDEAAKTAIALKSEMSARAASSAANDQFLKAQAAVAEIRAREERVSLAYRAFSSRLTELGVPTELHAFGLAAGVLRERRESLARLEQAAFLLESSSAQDRIASSHAEVERLRGAIEIEKTKLANRERAAEAARQIDNAAKAIPNEILAEQFDTVMPLLKELYRRLRPHADWQELDIDFGGRIRASLNFTVGDGRNPQFLFSSGQRRAAGIAFLLAMHLSRPWCKLHSLLLDDPVQHVDDYRALNLVEVLSAIRRTGRQIIIAVEDPSLADVLCRRLRSAEREGGVRFELGPTRGGSASIIQQRVVSPLLRRTLAVYKAS